MATLKQIYDLASDHVNLGPRVVAAVRRKANHVLGAGAGAATEIGTKLAKAALRDIPDYEQQFRTQIADNATAQTNAYSGGDLDSGGIPDNDIIYIIDVTWELVAGLYFTPTPEEP